MSIRSPQQYLFKVTWSGTIGTEEIFVYNRWVTFASDVEDTVADWYEDNVGVMLAFTVTAGPIATLQNLFTDYVVWNQLKVSPWNPATNKLKAGREPAYRVLTDHGNSAASSGMSYQDAFAMTTRSTLAGHRKFGRFYLPTVSHTATDGHGVLQPAVVTALATWYHTTIETDADDGGMVAVHYNPGTDNGNPSEAGSCWGIKDVYLGARLDTIRRRRNEAPEPRTTMVIAGP